MNISLRQIVGKHCTLRVSEENSIGGDRIRAMISEAWNQEKNFIISFKDVQATTPSFIDEAFGKLALDHDINELKEKISFVDYDENIKEKINRSIKNRFLKKDQILH